MAKGYKYPGPIKSDHDPIYEDIHGMTLTMNQMADRLVNVEMTSIFKDKAEGDVDTLAYLLENGFKGYHKMSPSELIEEYSSVEDKWYEYYQDDELVMGTDSDDPIQKLEEEAV